MSKQAVRHSRNARKETTKPEPKAKFVDDNDFTKNQTQSTPKFTAANKHQSEALAMLRAGCSVLFLTGSAGVGKSLLATYHAASLLKQKKIDKIYLVRPAVATGKTLGMLPGELSEKLSPFFAQTIAHFKTHMGNGFTEYCLKSGTIEYKAVEYLRGTSFEDAVVIFEEAQNFTHEEFEMLLTRLGKNCTFIFTADERQHDLKGKSGLTTTLSMIDDVLDKEPDYLNDEELNDLDSLIGVVRFTPDDVVRSGLTRAVVKMYYHQ
jgi:phosphate starvation-inducible PhoH-like protein